MKRLILYHETSKTATLKILDVLLDLKGSDFRLRLPNSIPFVELLIIEENEKKGE